MRRRYRVSVLSQFAFDDDVLLSGDLLGSSGSVNPDMPTPGAPAYVVGSQSSGASAPRQERLRAYGLCCGVEAFGDTLGGPGFADEGIDSDGSVACRGIQVADKGDDDRTLAGQAQFDQRPNSLGAFAPSTSNATRPSSKTWSSKSWGSVREART